MRRSELESALRTYRHAIGACEELSVALRSTQDAAEKVPYLRRAVDQLRRAHAALEQIGDGLAILPELVEEVIEEKRISGLLRRQARAQGIKVRYDPELSKDVTKQTEDIAEPND